MKTCHIGGQEIEGKKKKDLETPYLIYASMFGVEIFFKIVRKWCPNKLSLDYISSI